ncbi:MAG: hypothetical protein WD972_01555 [Candidatus Andersenbacteria bacterium]
MKLKKCTVFLSPALRRLLQDKDQHCKFSAALAAGMKLPMQIVNYCMEDGTGILNWRRPFTDYPPSMARLFKGGHAENAWMVDAFKGTARIETHIELFSSDQLLVDIVFLREGQKIGEAPFRIHCHVGSDGNILRKQYDHWR